jgi:hypothetical protein
MAMKSGVDLSGSGMGPVAISCEDSKGSVVSIKGGTFRDSQGENWCNKKASAPWRLCLSKRRKGGGIKIM